MSNLNNAEERALRFYIGDTSGCDPFYSDPQAYVTLNSLFFPDIISEAARAAEGKRLNPEIIADIPRLMEFFETLFSAFGKAIITDPLETYRVERLSDYILCREKSATVSMTSTSLDRFLERYRDRRGIALMRFILPEGTHCINAAELLEYYAKPEEAEILLPPFTKLTITEKPLSEKELTITDSDGKSPAVSCMAAACGITEFSGKAPDIWDISKAAEQVYSALNRGKIPEKPMLKEYSEWKISLQIKLHKMLYDKL